MEYLNQIILRRKNGFCMPVGMVEVETPAKAQLVLTANSQMVLCGYTLSKAAVEALLAYPEEILIQILTEVLKQVDSLSGNNRSYLPFYKNFPHEVLDLTEAELYWNAILHYLSGGQIYPQLAERSAANGDNKQSYEKLLSSAGTLTVLEILDSKVAEDIAENLAYSTVGISPSDLADLQVIMEKTSVVLDYNRVSCKETAAFLSGILLNNKQDFASVQILNKTIRDIIRTAASLSGADVSLSKKPHFKSFKRSVRRQFLGLIEKQKFVAEDWKSNHTMLIRLGERLHPAEYTKQFPQTAAHFKLIRETNKIRTFNTDIERLLQQGYHWEAAEKLSQRPGDFARRLNQLLKNAFPDEQQAILGEFAKVAHKVPLNTLLQLRQFFNKAHEEKESRVFFIKGTTTKTFMKEEHNQGLPKITALEAVKICEDALTEKFKSQKRFNKVYIDPVMGDFLVPFGQRSQNKSSRPVSRGSRFKIPIGQKNTIRLFVWWKNIFRKRRIRMKTDSQSSESEQSFVTELASPEIISEDEAVTEDNIFFDLDMLEFDSLFDESFIEDEDYSFEERMVEERTDIDLSLACYDSEMKPIVDISYYNLRDKGLTHSGDIVNASGPKGAAEFIDICLDQLDERICYIIPQINVYSWQNFRELSAEESCSFGWMQIDQDDPKPLFRPRDVQFRMDIQSESNRVAPVLFDLKDKALTWLDLSVGKGLTELNNIHYTKSEFFRQMTAIRNLNKPSLETLLQLKFQAEDAIVGREEADVIFGLERGDNDQARLITPFETDVFLDYLTDCQ
ncbi:MAG: hypothetical protein PWP16_819 [Eubacteriaceae bacterium]|nr:hypothetical protein [Eubacteriaceae bacterium]MDK2905186.1 hypothetical protein [Eubacteriaceae bacterium]MDK2937451.1 hypothetical protein [Eubacteriaceae bacterium]MDK2961584.1 hypothetical protein [Eubacteriaceae bacterium]MDN5307456.1 hypothetical protein [Eubacteriaceae bacterium]